MPADGTSPAVAQLLRADTARVSTGDIPADSQAQQTMLRLSEHRLPGARIALNVCQGPGSGVPAKKNAFRSCRSGGGWPAHVGLSRADCDLVLRVLPP